MVAVDSLAELADLDPADLVALSEAAADLFVRREFAAAVRAYAGLEALTGRRDFRLRRAEAEVEAGQTEVALATLQQLLDAEVAADLITAGALRLRARLRKDSDPEGARIDLEMAAKFDARRVSWP